MINLEEIEEKSTHFSYGKYYVRDYSFIYYNCIDAQYICIVCRIWRVKRHLRDNYNIASNIMYEKEYRYFIDKWEE